MDNCETVDAVVIGASIRGLVTAYVLSELGLRAVLVERSRRVGGADGSFVTAGGSLFDHGLHVLDAHRSELATELFTYVVEGRVHDVALRRAIALRNHVMPYSPAPADMPLPLREMLPGMDLVDDVGDAAPTRERLARCYGRPFTDLVFDEVLPSFPSEARHLAFGIDESRLMANMYPWFFPRASRNGASGDESRAFHDKLRAGIEQRILYPMSGGFGGFAEGFLKHLDKRLIEVIVDGSDLRIQVRPGTHSVDHVFVHDRRFKANHFFWASAWNPLCSLLDVPCQNAITDTVLLGSFRLNRPVNLRYHEILVGDPQHHINRIHFPAAFRQSDDPLMQVEFAVPCAEPWPMEADHWQNVWTGSARRLGLLDSAHHVEEFDFRSFRMHFNAFGAEGEALRDADPSLLRSDSNIHPVVPSMANLNLNRYVARVVRCVAAAVGREEFHFSFEQGV